MSKAILLFPPLAISMIIPLINPSRGFALWSLGLGLLVTQTGYQLDIGTVRVSALELAVVLLLGLALLPRARLALPSLANLPGRRWLLSFSLYSTVILVLGLLRQDSFTQAIMEYKGFLLYPLMAYILVLGLHKHQMLRWAVITVVAWYTFVAGFGLIEYIQQAGGEQLVRVSGDYATINGYGITLMCMALLVAGMALHAPRRSWRILGLLLAVWLFSGAVVSVARTVWIAFPAGLLLMLFGTARRSYTLALLVLVVVLLNFLPGNISGRILQLSDSSTVKRSYYLTAGLHAWEASPVLGWGWGNAYWYSADEGLIASNDIPWYHNDYLNLAVQTGSIGLVLYLGYWLTVLTAGARWLSTRRTSPTAGYVQGAQAALFGLLVAAAFEHVLWRPDVAGLLGWLSGILLAAMIIGAPTSAEPSAS